MKIIIEVAGGCVQSVYSDGPIPATLDVIVADFDEADSNGLPLTKSCKIESIKHASADVVNAITKMIYE